MRQSAENCFIANLFIGIDPGQNDIGIGLVSTYGPKWQCLRLPKIADNLTRLDRFCSIIPTFVGDFIEAVHNDRDFGLRPDINKHVIFEDFLYQGKNPTTSNFMLKVLGACYGHLEARGIPGVILYPPLANRRWERDTGASGYKGARARREHCQEYIGYELDKHNLPNEHECDALFMAQWLQKELIMLDRAGVPVLDMSSRLVSTDRGGKKGRR